MYCKLRTKVYSIAYETDTSFQDEMLFPRQVSLAPTAQKPLFFTNLTMPLVYNAAHGIITRSVNNQDPPCVVTLAVDQFKSPYLNTHCQCSLL